MTDKIICFSFGLSEQDIEKGKTSFYSLNKEAPELGVIAVHKNMLGLPVGVVLGSMLFGSGLNTTEEQNNSEINLAPDVYQYRVVIVHTELHAMVLQVMRSFKAVLSDPQNIIFAVITETAMNWTFEDYLVHLGEEHEYMKNRRPENNPDMKKM